MNAPSAQPSPTRPSSSTFSRRPPRPGRHRPGAPPRAAGDHRPPRGERRPALQSTAIRRRHCPGSRSVVQLVTATADPRSDRSTRPNEAECTPNGMARCLLRLPALKANNRRSAIFALRRVCPVRVRLSAADDALVCRVSVVDILAGFEHDIPVPVPLVRWGAAGEPDAPVTDATVVDGGEDVVREPDVLDGVASGRARL